jgi:hypothetical protein
MNLAELDQAREKDNYDNNDPGCNPLARFSSLRFDRLREFRERAKQRGGAKKTE